jgi:anti-anti-sigma factor
LPSSDNDYPSIVICASTDSHGRVVLRVAGEIDLATCPSLQEAFASDTVQTATELVIDLSEAGFMDSNGLHALVDITREIRGRGGSVSLRAPSEPIHRMLEIAGLLTYFSIT